MNWNMIEGKWKELSGQAKERWGDLTNDELVELGGKREKLEGILQLKYGITQEAAANQIDEWAGRLKEKL
jgi:uncharacterized protein YjbJ (UPF0337 family)